MSDNPLFTIGFTKTSAKHFFERLQFNKVKTIIDVRLNNTSQLAGFAKSEDLRYFLRSICGIIYNHSSLLAPTKLMLDNYRKEHKNWRVYEKQFMDLLAERNVESKFKAEEMGNVCLLCSEDTPHYCHRRLVCEYLNSKWGGVLTVKHL